MNAVYTHPTYIINHKPCGHSESKQILESSEYKRQAVKKALESMKCVSCINKAAK